MIYMSVGRGGGLFGLAAAFRKIAVVKVLEVYSVINTIKIYLCYFGF